MIAVLWRCPGCARPVWLERSHDPNQERFNDRLEQAITVHMKQHERS